MGSGVAGIQLAMTFLVSREGSGHRAEYVTLFTSIIARAGGKVRLSRRAWRHVFSTEPMLFMMFEDSPLECFLISLFRGLMGLQTAAILFKPAECVAPRALRWRAKRWALMLLQRLQRVSVIVIIPFSVEPRLSAIARHGIYDPQLWDIEDLGRADGGDPEFVSQIADQARGRGIVVAMGRQAEDKGFGYFSCLLNACPTLGKQNLFVSAGIVATDSLNSADALVTAGGTLLNRDLTEAEMTSLYRSASLIWCCYAPSRDMASGIFGRAVQYGTPTIVRAGSYLEKLAAELHHPAIAVPWNDPQGVARLLSVRPPPPSPPDQRQALVRRLRDYSLAAIHTALGLQ
jgi:hypothetical protein